MTTSTATPNDKLIITFTDDGMTKLAAAYTAGTGTNIPKVTFTYETRVSLIDSDKYVCRKT